MQSGGVVIDYRMLSRLLFGLFAIVMQSGVILLTVLKADFLSQGITKWKKRDCGCYVDASSKDVMPVNRIYKEAKPSSQTAACVGTDAG